VKDKVEFIRTKYWLVMSLQDDWGNLKNLLNRPSFEYESSLILIIIISRNYDVHRTANFNLLCKLFD